MSAAPETMRTRYCPSGKPSSAPRCEIDPLYFRNGSNISFRGEAEFLDSPHWQELAAKHLTRFNLPAWKIPCSMEEMARWLDRLDLTERDHLRMTSTSLNDFIDLNPHWPLRAWIGLMLEAREGQQ